MALTDKLRAAVFARDKGICAFSGLSVWMLDYGAAPFSHADWPDHIKPVSRGGRDTVDNLVCASYFYNRKKLNNGGDCQYLFSGGAPTDIFYWRHGELSDQQAAVLTRHAPLTETDWYFNRAIFNLLVAIGNEASGERFVRGRDFWIKSAQKRLATWRKLSGEDGAQSIVARGLVPYPDAPDCRLMLQLATAPEQKLPIILSRLARHYLANCKALDSFAAATTQARRLRVLAQAEASPTVTAPLLDCLRNNARRLFVAGR